jgi:hydroxymethylbilane synthase
MTIAHSGGRSLRVATRSSPLALWQAHHVAGLLGLDIEIVKVETKGDQRRDVAIEEIRGQGVFVKEVQAAVLDGRADIAVHSAKDLMAQPTPGLVIAAVPERGDVRDALVGNSVQNLAPGASVATGSVRRRVQLAEMRPDLTFSGLRGNIDTRIAKASEYDAVIIAYTSVLRLQREVDNLHVLEPDVMLPQVGQGALAVECREDDDQTRELLSSIEHADSRRAVDAERSFLAALGGGCDQPVACYAVIEGDLVFMRAMIASLDGHSILRTRGSAFDGVALGRNLVQRLLIDSGGAALFDGAGAANPDRAL